MSSKKILTACGQAGGALPVVFRFSLTSAGAHITHSGRARLKLAQLLTGTCPDGTCPDCLKVRVRNF